MPPKGRLSDESIAAFAKWVATEPSGPRKGPLNASHAHPIDRGTGPSRGQGRRAAAGPDRLVRPADRSLHLGQAPGGRLATRAPRRSGVLLRRLTFDLIGLPPTPEEPPTSSATPARTRWPGSSTACSPRRTTASDGAGTGWTSPITPIRPATTPTIPCPEAGTYRDYIINSFNRDKPYDQFVREQLAGDILARKESGEDTRNPSSPPGSSPCPGATGPAPFELWHLTLEDAIETTGRAFLGLTLRCARCHDHKFDPVAQSDYYALYGMFASTSFPWAGSEETQSKGFPRMNSSRSWSRVERTRGSRRIGNGSPSWIG